MDILSVKSKYPVGIDISDLSLKLAQLKKTGNKISLQAISKIIIPEGYIINGEIKTKAAVIELIQKLIKNTIFGKVTSAEAVVCLPETKTFTKLISVPNLDQNKQKLEETIINEMEKHIPFRMENINYDWQLIKNEGDYSKILIGVIEKDIANAYSDLIKSAGLLPVALEIEPVAIARSIISYESMSETALIIDIGASHAGLIAYADGTILFTASLPVSGEKYSRMIAKKLKMPLKKAEDAKIVCGLEKKAAKGAVADILQKMTSELISKIKIAAAHLNNHYPEYSPAKKIYLCGGGASMNGLDKIIAKKLKIEAKAANVFNNISVSEHKKNIFFAEEFATLKTIAKNHQRRQNFSPIFATAVGLALRNIYVDEL